MERGFEPAGFLSENCGEIILIKGNHDTILGPIAERKDVLLADNYFFPDSRIYITHGHKIPHDQEFENADVLIIAHDHPALGLREEMRVEKVKCFMLGSWKNKGLIVMPSFNFVTEGVDILQESLLSPFLKQNLDNFRVWGVENSRILYFGRVGEL